MRSTWEELYGLASELRGVPALVEEVERTGRAWCAEPTFANNEAFQKARAELRWQEVEATRLSEKWASIEYWAARVGGAEDPFR